MTGAAVPRRVIGRELKRLREQSGIPATAACKAIEVSAQTLWRIESGQPGPKMKSLYVRVLCQMYGATTEVTAALATLAAEPARPCWWHRFRDVLPEKVLLHMELEEAAERVTSFQLDLIPDLLQTPEYQQVLLRTEQPGRSPQDVNRIIEVLRRRTEQLRNINSTFILRALICEIALHRGIGGNEVMREQLQHLLTISQMPSVSIRIVPRRSGCHLGLITGSFELMEFPVHPVPELTEPPVVYVPGYTTAQYLDQEQQIGKYRAALAEIQRRTLSEEASRQLLLDVSRIYLE